ncbi:uncharacterized protein LOC128127792 [Lactuca sativa]|uniref:uncharacterized protein LOC128127792 n=1 Tax=Lactuca sativa TaxID=4236 RepID=UPI0022AE618D|nr:uncharacterized protein LOC128127792 [Lactuca sativa]
MDLFGPVNVLSINRNSYCLVVIDDFSRFTWVFFPSNKVGVADLIRKFIVLIENQTNNRVKALRTDSGTEFKNYVLDHFCAEKGYAARTAYRVYNKKTKQVVESYDVRWLEENETDARVGSDWLFDYTSLFKSINVSSCSSFGSISGLKNVSEDEDKEVVYRPPMVSSSQPEEETPASPEGESFASPEGESSVHPNSSKSPIPNTTPDAEITPLTPIEREFMSKDSSADTSTFMKLLFLEDFSNEFVAESSGATIGK